MPQANLTRTIQKPTAAEVHSIAFRNDEGEPGVTIKIHLRDENGEIVQTFQDVLMEGDVPGFNGFMTSFENAIVPKLIERIEAQLGITFA